MRKKILTISVDNQKAELLLDQLEKLQIIKIVHNPEKKPMKSGQTLSKKYFGKLPKAVAEEFDKYLMESRQQWNRTI